MGGVNITFIGQIGDVLNMTGLPLIIHYTRIADVRPDVSRQTGMNGHTSPRGTSPSEEPSWSSLFGTVG